MKRQNGFTLIENLCAIVIIAVIMTVVTKCIMISTTWFERSELYSKKGDIVADVANGCDTPTEKEMVYDATKKNTSTITVKQVTTTAQNLPDLIISDSSNNTICTLKGNINLYKYSYTGTYDELEEISLNRLEANIENDYYDSLEEADKIFNWAMNLYTLSKSNTTEGKAAFVNYFASSTDNRGNPEWWADLYNDYVDSNPYKLSEEFVKYYNLKENGTYLNLYLHFYTMGYNSFIVYASKEPLENGWMGDAYLIYNSNDEKWYVAPKSADNKDQFVTISFDKWVSKQKLTINENKIVETTNGIKYVTQSGKIITFDQGENKQNALFDSIKKNTGGINGWTALEPMK